MILNNEDIETNNIQNCDEKEIYYECVICFNKV